MKQRPAAILSLHLVGLLLAFECIPVVQDLNAALIIQSTTATPLRRGAGAQQLSDQDITAIEKLTPDNKKPWLLSGDLGGMLIPRIEAYLPPTTQTPEIRRGTMITLQWPADAPITPQGPPNVTGPKVWTVIEANGAYAQVPVAGRTFDQIRSDQDVDRPFSVVGAFDDAELLSIVNFVRTYSGPPRDPGPLRSVSRADADRVVVFLSESAYRSTRLVLGKQGQGWVILSNSIIQI